MKKWHYMTFRRFLSLFHILSKGEGSFNCLIDTLSMFHKFLTLHGCYSDFDNIISFFWVVVCEGIWISSRTSWPQTHRATEDGFKFLNPLPLLPKCWVYRYAPLYLDGNIISNDWHVLRSHYSICKNPSFISGTS